MTARVLLNVLNELRKRDIMRGLSSISSLFLNEFNKSNHTGTGMLTFSSSPDIKINQNMHF